MILFAKRFCLLWLFFGLGMVAVFPKTNIYGGLSLGYGFNIKTYKIAQEKLTSAQSITTSPLVLFQFPIYQNVFVETGAGAQFIFSKGQIGLSSYTSRSLKFYLPLRLGYSLNDSYDASLGVSIQNNKDIEFLHIAGSYNLRYDMTLQFSYNLGGNWLFYAGASSNIGLPAVYYMNLQRFRTYAGVYYRFSSR